jgi:hypothetical protein
VLLCAVALLFSVYSQRKYLFRETPYQVAREVYWLNPFPEAIPISKYIRDHSAPNARVAVLGPEPEIYFYSHRHSATGYLYTYPLFEDQPYATKMRDEMIHDVEFGMPEYVVQMDSLDIWAYQAEGRPSLFSWWGEWGPKHYDKVAIADIISMDRTEYRWGAEAAAYKPKSDYILAVYKRKP